MADSGAGQIVDSRPEFDGRGHARCRCEGVRSETNPRLAIRTVLVSTRAAVRSNLAAGDPVMAQRSAERGIELLDVLDARAENGEVSREYGEARKALRSLAGLDEDEPARAAYPPLPSRTHQRST